MWTFALILFLFLFIYFFCTKIASFSRERQAIQKYNKFINNAYKSTVHQGTVAGLGIGCVIMIVFCSYALAVWYGATLILNKGYNGGEVINVMLAVMIGAM